MKKPIFTSVLVFMFFCAFSQNYDLIVTTKGDSLACHIDSVSDSYLYFEMIRNYNRIHTMLSREQAVKYERNVISKRDYNYIDGTSYIKAKRTIVAEGYQHAHKLMFAPTSFALKEGDLYYTTNYGIIHSLQYGFSDNVSSDIGTTLIGLPWYGMLNVSFPLGKKTALMFGDLFIFNLFFDDPGIVGNLAYGMVSLGEAEKNLNIGIGHLYFPDQAFPKSSAPALTLSGQIKTGKRSYFLTENYATYMNDRYWPEAAENLDPPYDRYVFRQYVLAGLTGIRIVGKNNPRLSWQFGIGYVILIYDDEIPDFFDRPGWDTHLEDGKVTGAPFPLISLSYIFGKRFK